MAETVGTRENNRVLYLKRYHHNLYLAVKHHRTHRNRRITFDRHQYLKAIYLDTDRYIVVKKSTQCGVTEWLITLAIAKAIHGRQVFYVLPNWFLMKRFVNNRLDKSILHTAAVFTNGMETR